MTAAGSGGTLPVGVPPEHHRPALAAASCEGPESLYLLALAALRGDRITRDLALARTALRLARERDHAAAALLEIALTANGTGGDPDWSAAHTLLQQAARRDPDAAAHLALVAAMAVTIDGHPAALAPVQLLSTTPYVAHARGAFSPDECAHLVMHALPLLDPGLVFDPQTGRPIAHPIRTSDSATIGPAHETLPIAAMNRRLAALTRTAWNAGEPLHVLRYTGGQEYRLHSDAVPGLANQRGVTAMIYLNHGFDGGETDFPVPGLRIAPRQGDVLVFRNVTPGGAVDPAARHAGLPVTRGAKWVATRWIRQAAFDPWAQPAGA